MRCSTIHVVLAFGVIATTIPAAEPCGDGPGVPEPEYPVPLEHHLPRPGYDLCLDFLHGQVQALYRRPFLEGDWWGCTGYLSTALLERKGRNRHSAGS
jgi:hypothetical protein